MTYLLDSNIFIQAKNLYYGLDFCPAFWDWLIEKNADGTVLSIEKVGDELQGYADDLSVWAAAQGDALFVPPDNTILPALANVSTWANGQNYEAAAISTFLQVADYWLVADALAKGYTVVTHEIPSNSVRKIKIPNACLGLSLPFVTPYEMLRREHARFILGRQTATTP
jgi:hypothetical protein